MEKTSALVILYPGEPLSDYVVGRIMEEITVSGQRPAEGIVVSSLNSLEVAQALCKVVEKEPAVVNSPELDALEAALVYIGERFSPLRKGSVEFVTQLCAAVNAEPHNIELEDSLAIISEKSPKPRNMKTLRKYGLDATKRQYIKQIYQQFYVSRDTKKVKITIK